MSSLKSGDLFKFILVSDCASAGLDLDEEITDPALLEEATARLRDMVMLAPLMRFKFDKEPGEDGRARCSADLA